VAASDLTVLASDGAHAIAVAGRVVAAVWRHSITTAHVRSVLSASQGASQRFPGEAVLAMLIEEKIPVPGDDVRKAMLEWIRAGKGLRCTVVVAEGSGFQQSLIRSVIAGLTLVVRPFAPLKVVATGAEAAAWASQQGTPAGGAAVERAVRETLEATRAKITAK
jgi:hypothetical protein